PFRSPASFRTKRGRLNFLERKLEIPITHIDSIMMKVILASMCGVTQGKLGHHIAQMHLPHEQNLAGFKNRLGFFGVLSNSHCLI
ncbi:MAG: hypothetical protein VSS75_029580, partial [Candidatus Parabeggiatoa sp.]|nr:hypothetical protein [Candidatus Parabeggiatoa sp.]